MQEVKLNIIPLKEWLNFPERPLIISGPCSAENKEQVLQTAKKLAKTGIVNVFRAGIWKPRTRPDAFEGVGEAGLPWLSEVKEKTGLPVCVEVATPQHVEAAIKNEIDILWLGARTTANPFSVQEIAEALKGYDIPVMIKNPVTPDLKLWIGAIERINKSKINKIIAIHRGFTSYENTVYRNAPIWEIPIELMRICPELPVICDPSHITGNSMLLESVCQKALDLEMDGMMIETHVNPKKALSDAKQQITPDELVQLISKLIIRSNYTENTEFTNKLIELRSEIDNIDVELIHLISKRMKIIEDIGKFKKENNITILQIRRWNDVVRESIELGEELGLNREFLLKLLRVIHEESIQKQTDIFKK
ncbi:MAG TPA: chorismate mutase [Bacteroidales bacterium]|nr:chorismate mutase [Bacteroidales bacterium]HPS16508.1 chorismate mutase [Bacteroidales bacterium]